MKFILALFLSGFLISCETTPEECPECPECEKCEDCDKYPNWGEIIKNICDCVEKQNQS